MSWQKPVFNEETPLTVGQMNGLSDGIEQVMNFCKALYPVGSILFSADNRNPGTYLTGTNWIAWGAGRVPVGIDTNDSDFGVPEKTDGSKDAVVVSHDHGGNVIANGGHSHSITDNGHTHNIPDERGTAFDHWGVATENASTAGGYPAQTTKEFTGITIVSAGNHEHTINSAGENGAGRNLQPYIVCYMWKRTA